MNDWRYVFGQNRATLARVRLLRCDVHDLHEQSSGRASARTSCRRRPNKGVLLALVAMAQTFVVITAGHRPFGRRDVRSDAIALPRGSWSGPARPAALGVAGVLLAGLACGALNGLIVIVGRLQPIVTTIATGAVFFGLALLLRPTPGGDVYGPLADALTGRAFRRPAGESRRARRGRPRHLDPLQPFGDRAGGLRGRLV